MIILENKWAWNQNVGCYNNDGHTRWLVIKDVVRVWGMFDIFWWLFMTRVLFFEFIYNSVSKQVYFNIL